MSIEPKIRVSVVAPDAPYATDKRHDAAVMAYDAHFIKMGKQRVAKHVGPRIRVCVLDAGGNERTFKDITINIHPLGTITVEDSEDYTEETPAFLLKEEVADER